MLVGLRDSENGISIDINYNITVEALFTDVAVKYLEILDLGILHRAGKKGE